MPGCNIQFSEAKNGEKTCSCDGKFLHSKYNPTAEAQKFVQNLNVEFAPRCIFLIEPALSYCANFLRERFSNSEICAIRFKKDFDSTNNLWDKIFYYSESLSDDLFNILGEEKICSSLFFDWTASRNAFLEESNGTWNAIKDSVMKSRNVMATRSYFSKRWTKNFAIFASNVRKVATVKDTNTNFPIIIAASGTSLKSSINFLKKFRKKYFLIAVSSAFMPLSENGIEPDFVITTDGGYWAKKHLEFSGSRKWNQIFAAATESALPKSVFKTSTIIPLLYDDCANFQTKTLERIGIETVQARRNGTVSGTALELAMKLTKGTIFLCGLDQAPSPEYQHTQPNALESNSEKMDTRLATKETRLTSSRFNSTTALEIYREWFISNSKKFNTPKERVYRLSDNFKFSFDLGEIKDVNWSNFENFCDKNNSDRKIEIVEIKKTTKTERKKIIIEELEKSLSDEKSLSEFFPMEILLLRREQNQEKKAELEKVLKSKAKDFVNEIKSKI